MHLVAQTHHAALVCIGAQRDLDVAQTLAPSQLGKCHHATLLGAAHAVHPGIAAVTIHDACKTRPRNKPHDLRKQRLADIHASPRSVSTPGKYTRMRIVVSNQHQTKSTGKPCQYWLSNKSNSN